MPPPMLHVEAPKLPPLIRRPAILRLLIIALIAETAYAVLNISTMPVYLVQDRHFGEFKMSLVVVAFLLSEAVFKGPMGHLADRYGCRTFMIAGPAITMCTALLTVAVPRDVGGWEATALITLRVFDGIGAAMLWPAAFAEMGHIVSDKERQQAMSLLNVCYLLGIALALPIGGIAEDIFNAKAAGLYLAAILFGGISLAAFRFASRSNIHDGASEAGEKEGFHVKQLIRSFRSIPVFVLLAVVTFAGIGFPMTIIKPFAIDEFNLSASQFGALVFPAAIAMAVFSVPMGRLGERLGKSRAVHIGLGLCATGLAFISLGAFLPALRVPWALALGGIPVGLGFLLTIPAWLTSVSDIDPTRRAANLGAIMTAQGLGAIIGAPMGALLYQEMIPVGRDLGFGDSFGHYSPFMGCAICMTVGWLLSMAILRDPKTTAETPIEETAELSGSALLDANIVADEILHPDK